MASFFLTQPLMTTTIPTISKASLCPFFKNRSQTPSNAKRKNKVLSRRSSISCMAREGGDQKNPNIDSNGVGKLDRRNVLFGLGGLYGVAGLQGSEQFAIAEPLLPPDLSKCSTPSGLPQGIKTECCPPFSDEIIDFKPPLRAPLRVRPAAHAVDSEYIAKYNEATKRMRELDENDPRNFMQQAKVHCAYCNGSYDQVNYPELDIQVHNSWLFFPFHRWYLHFYEKILGKLIDDPTFALPFWNWDHPSGMQMPAMFTNKSSALYDEKRSNKHQPPSIVDLNFSTKDEKSYQEQVNENLSVMYQSMVSGAKLPLLFFGEPYSQGSEKEPGAGTVERTPHTAVHIWGGSERNREPNGEDMGNFYSAGRDPLFYCHHANVDRMWNLWKTVGGPKRKDIKDPDFLDAAFLFYDENARLVRVKVRDCLDTKRLGYIYEDVPLPWLYKKQKPHKSKYLKMLKSLGVARASDAKRVALSDFPVTLTDSMITAVVQRPTKGRSKEEKEEEEEVLVIEGIEFDKELAVKFDVYINDEDAPGADKSEFAGSFGNVPHKLKPGAQHSKVSLKLGISDLLDDVGADDDESIIVALVPKSNYPVTIGGIKIELVS
ncbi:hypothetical protein TIFTF001_020007 [Ficus carica]|uniref:Tyrosinase copper-binding domain-containing protein n=1 Tax=Ficus carica TaxID=3494 RepID=A0AA88ATJ8_FICCA|nr:hypothetical protein TIFTF001_020007 [Ficus carica]